MTCPNCQETLTMSARQGVEIDFCPKCRGIWLDRGELDKLLEREAALVGGRARSHEHDRPRRHRDDDDDDYRRGRKSFWRELFD
jgi:Zn-finger nucleic acid-binding protein